MENRERVVAEYFQLRVLLNRANSRSNERTELQFVVRQIGVGYLSFGVTLKGIAGASFLEICKRPEALSWGSSGFSGLYYLEGYCADFLQLRWSKDFNEADMSNLCSQLLEELGSLGITF